ncbi:MAG: hypothetical protein JO042_00055 [Sinobacteraceae bacterium]|nr:hypothetical protein [Nevskiaceae bacterium]
MIARQLLPAVILVALAGCNRADQARPDWIISSRLVFLADDLRSPWIPVPRGYRLTFPYIAGDIYGPPTTGDFIKPVWGAEGRFHIDLNPTHEALLKSLEPTNFSVSYLRIDPPEARVARLAPMMLEADGIEQTGRLDWFDPDVQRVLLLLYVDRPATISGRVLASGRPLRYAIRAGAAGYLWVERRPEADEDVYTVTPKPARLLLAARPLVNGR